MGLVEEMVSALASYTLSSVDMLIVQIVPASRSR